MIWNSYHDKPEKDGLLWISSGKAVSVAYYSGGAYNTIKTDLAGKDFKDGFIYWAPMDLPEMLTEDEAREMEDARWAAMGRPRTSV